MDDESLKKYAYVSISSYRTKAVKSLKNEVKMPTEIAEDTGIRKNHISKVLSGVKMIRRWRMPSAPALGGRSGRC